MARFQMSATYAGKAKGESGYCFTQPSKAAAEAKLAAELLHRPHKAKTAAIDQLPNGQWRVRV